MRLRRVIRSFNSQSIRLSFCGAFEIQKGFAALILVEIAVKDAEKQLAQKYICGGGAHREDQPARGGETMIDSLGVLYGCAVDDQAG